MTELTASTTWERRKAEQAARRTDPVEGFYLRHGSPAGRTTQVMALGAAAAAEDE